MSKKHTNLDNVEDFSIVLGGPLYQLYRHLRLVEPPLKLCRRRMIVISMFTWLPLLILATFGGVAISGVNIPFIFDLETHVRFLLALTLLIGAEVFVHQRIGTMVAQFLQRDIIAPTDQIKFRSYLESAIKLRNSFLAEIIIVMFAFVFGHSLWELYAPLDVSTWYAEIIDGKAKLNLAGYWYIFISLPIFQFLLLRWYYRIFVWYRLLWKISSLRLHLNSLHPDHAGGISFLALSILAFAPFLLAHTVLLAGMITNRIWHEGLTLLDFKLEMLGIIGFLIALVLFPLFFFILPMARAKRIGTNSYGIMASHFVNIFSNKWVDTKTTSAKVLGASDIQSLADLSNSYVATRDMSILPFSFGNVLQLVLLAALPLLPLIFTLLPLVDIIRCVVRVFI